MTLEQAIVELPDKRTIRVAPDALTRKVCDAPGAMIPHIGLFAWQAVGEGTYKPVLKLHSRTIRVARAAQLLDVDYFVLRRLIRAGFVAGSQPSPGCCLIDLHSYFAHVAAVAEDPDFWNDANSARYSAAL